VAGDDDWRAALGKLEVQNARLDQKMDDMLRRQSHTEGLLTGANYITRSEFQSHESRILAMEGYWRRIAWTIATAIILALLSLILIRSGVPK